MKSSRLVVVATLLALTVGLVLGSPSSSSANNAKVSDEKFSKMVAGTYLLYESEDVSLLVTLTADGNFIEISSVGALFGITAHQGAWSRIGKHQIAIRSVVYFYNIVPPVESDDPPLGKLVNTVTARFVVNFSNKKKGKYQTAKGSVTLFAYPPDQNPLAPTVDPVFTLDATFEGDRVNVD